jgi:energy-coupling factor transporter ATP-binding protein EcfA2
MAVIETERLTKLYGSSRGIEDVSFSVEAGEVFGFLGPNGAGKTTAIRTLLDMLHPTRGRPGSSASTAIARASRSAPGSATFPAISAMAGRPAGARRCGSSPGCEGSTDSGAPRPWPSASAPTSTVRSASSRAATARRSA